MKVTAMLADHVDVGNGKLYVSGGAWGIYTVTSLPARLPRVGVAVAIHVPWTATNQNHKFSVRLIDEDGGPVPLGEDQTETGESQPIKELGGDFNVGRPPNVPHGDEQVIPIPITIDGLLIKTPGSYTFIITIDGSEVERLPFRVQLPPPGVQMAG